jgi:hypothetical protein
VFRYGFEKFRALLGGLLLDGLRGRSAGSSVDGVSQGLQTVALQLSQTSSSRHLPVRSDAMDIVEVKEDAPSLSGIGLIGADEQKRALSTGTGIHSSVEGSSEIFPRRQSNKSAISNSATAAAAAAAAAVPSSTNTSKDGGQKRKRYSEKERDEIRTEEAEEEENEQDLDEEGVPAADTAAQRNFSLRCNADDGFIANEGDYGSRKCPRVSQSDGPTIKESRLESDVREQSHWKRSKSEHVAGRRSAHPSARVPAAAVAPSASCADRKAGNLVTLGSLQKGDYCLLKSMVESLGARNQLKVEIVEQIAQIHSTQPGRVEVRWFYSQRNLIQEQLLGPQTAQRLVEIKFGETDLACCNVSESFKDTSVQVQVVSNPPLHQFIVSRAPKGGFHIKRA